MYDKSEKISNTTKKRRIAFLRRIEPERTVNKIKGRRIMGEESNSITNVDSVKKL